MLIEIFTWMTTQDLSCNTIDSQLFTGKTQLNGPIEPGFNGLIVGRIQSKRDIRAPIIKKKGSLIGVNEVKPKKRPQLKGGITKTPEKPKVTCRNRNPPKIKSTIFRVKNVNPNETFTINLFKNVFGHQITLCKKKISNAKTPFRFSVSKFIPRNSMDAILISTFMPKETPINFIDFMEDSIMDGINR